MSTSLKSRHIPNGGVNHRGSCGRDKPTGFSRGWLTPGYLYVISDEIDPDDVYPHPHPANVGRWEWLTNRELKLELIEQTIVTDSERLTDEDIAEIRRKQEERGEESFAE